MTAQPADRPVEAKLGKRYECVTCGAVLLCVKESKGGGFECCGQPMRPLEMRQVPSSD
jgi:transcription elongation factor Elf1